MTLTATFEKDNFFYKITDDLKEVCNAPKNKSGIYQFYDITNGGKELIYIGCSGHIKKDGQISTRKTGGGGIYGRIVNGHQFGKEKRHISIPKEMKKENIQILEVEWIITFEESIENIKYSPIYVESYLLQRYYEENGKLPKWNLKF